MNRYQTCLTMLVVAQLIGCSDPKNPQTWIQRLRDPQHAAEAVKRLEELRDPVAVKPLCELFDQYQSANILKAIVSFKHPDAIPTLIKALDYNDTNYHNASIAAAALAEMKAHDAIPALNAALKKPLAIQSRANVAKLSAIDALAKLKSHESVPTLIEVAGARPEDQDFLLNKRAIEALGEIGDPQAVPVLCKGLFMASTVQGTSFPQARVALVRVGTPAVEPLIRILHGDDKTINDMAKELEFAPGVMVNKAAIVLGDLMAREAVGDLLQELKAGDLQSETLNGVIEALGKINDPRAIDPLLAVVSNKKAGAMLRVQAATALTLISGSEKALPTLLKLAETTGADDDAANVQGGAAMAYSRIVVGPADAGIATLRKVAEGGEQSPAGQLLREALDRATLGQTCGSDVSCYASKLNDANISLPQREKAGLMLGRLADGRKGLDLLVQALPTREPILRLVYLETAKRIGTADDAALIKTLTELAAKDSQRSSTFLGGDLASADKIALAAVQRNK